MVQCPLSLERRGRLKLHSPAAAPRFSSTQLLYSLLPAGPFSRATLLAGAVSVEALALSKKRMSQLAVQFLIRYAGDVNPPNRMREFSDGLHQYITAEAGLACLWGGQGGMATVYGVIYREDETTDISIADREQIVGWIREQRIDCTATFGDPEPIDSYDMMRDLTELVFDVHNLTDEDRDQGREYRESLLDRFKATGWKPVEPD